MKSITDMQHSLGANPLSPDARGRTYRQIAAIFKKREGTNISPERVRQICGAAERKIARALLADPEFQATQFGASGLSLRKHTQ